MIHVVTCNTSAGLKRNFSMHEGLSLPCAILRCHIILNYYRMFPHRRESKNMFTLLFIVAHECFDLFYIILFKLFCVAKKNHTKGIGQCIILYGIIEIFDFVNKSIKASNIDLHLVVALCVLFCSYHILFYFFIPSIIKWNCTINLIIIKRTLLIFHWSDKQIIPPSATVLDLITLKFTLTKNINLPMNQARI